MLERMRVAIGIGLIGLSFAASDVEARTRYYNGCSQEMRDDLDLVDDGTVLLSLLGLDYMSGEVVANPQPYETFFGPWTALRGGDVEVLVEGIAKNLDTLTYDCTGAIDECATAYAAVDPNTTTVYLCPGFWDLRLRDDLFLVDQRLTILHEFSHIWGTVNAAFDLYGPDDDRPVPWDLLSMHAQQRPAQAIHWAEAYQYFYGRLPLWKSNQLRRRGCDCRVGGDAGTNAGFTVLVCGMIVALGRKRRPRTRPMTRTKLLGVLAIGVVVVLTAVWLLHPKDPPPAPALPPAPMASIPRTLPSPLSVAAPAPAITAPAAPGFQRPKIPIWEPDPEWEAGREERAKTRWTWPEDAPIPPWIPKPPPEIQAAQPGDRFAGTLLAKPVDMGLSGRFSVVGTPRQSELRLRFELTNKGKKTLVFRVEQTLFDTPFAAAVRLRDEGDRRIPWKYDKPARHFDRWPGPRDYLSINPGETLVAERDLAKYWTLPPSGRIHIAPVDPWLADVYEGTEYERSRGTWQTKTAMPTNELDVDLVP